MNPRANTHYRQLAPTAVPTQPQQTALECAAQWLQQATAPVCVVGRGALAASSQLLALSTRLNTLLFCSTPGAKGIFPERHPRAAGVCGFAGHASALRVIHHADVLLVLGTQASEPSLLGWQERLLGPKVIRVDLAPERALTLGSQQLALQGDIGALLVQLCALLAPQVNPPAITEVRLSAAASDSPSQPLASPLRAFDAHTHADSGNAQGSNVEDGFVSPRAMMDVLSAHTQHVPVCCDAGNAMCWAIENLVRNEPRQFQVSLQWGSMGFAIPAAMGVSLARERQPAIALTGDGSLAMAGGELHTAVELELPLVVVALNDAGAGMVASGAEAWLGPNAIASPRYRHRINLCGFARALGAHAEVITSLQRFDTCLQAALQRPTPTLLDVHVTAEVPPAVRARVAGLSQIHSARRIGGGMC